MTTDTFYPDDFYLGDIFGLLRPVNKSLGLAIFQNIAWDNDNDPGKSNLLLDQILFDLNEDETSLMGGRFKNFTRLQKYEHSTSVPVNSNNIFSGPLIDTKQITEKLDWIQESVKQKWSITIIPHQLYFNEHKLEGGFHVEFDFSFENKIEAGHFALRWR